MFFIVEGTYEVHRRRADLDGRPRHHRFIRATWFTASSIGDITARTLDWSRRVDRTIT